MMKLIGEVIITLVILVITIMAACIGIMLTPFISVILGVMTIAFFIFVMVHEASEKPKQ